MTIAEKAKEMNLKKPRKIQILIDAEFIHDQEMKYRALNHGARQQIISFLEDNDDKAVSVTDIYIAVGLEQSVASGHLKILKDAGFLESERQGKNIYYSINFENLRKFVSQ